MSESFKRALDGELDSDSMAATWQEARDEIESRLNDCGWFLEILRKTKESRKQEPIDEDAFVAHMQKTEFRNMCLAIPNDLKCSLLDLVASKVLTSKSSKRPRLG